MSNSRPQLKGDGTGRPLRNVQRDALAWIERNWDATNVFALQLPTGTGKSLIAKALVDACGGHVITPTNILLDQYHRQYKDVTVVKGFNTYDCHDGEEMSCGEHRAITKRFCSGCPALKAAIKARSGKPVFANPISYRALQFGKGWVPPNVLVVDEAHKLFSMAKLMHEDKLRADEFDLPRLTNEVDLRNWMDKRIAFLRGRLDANFSLSHEASVRQMAKQWQRLSRLRVALNEPENMVMEWRSEYWRGRKKDFLYLTPIEPPRYLFDQLLRAKKLVLMSATLFPSDVKELVGDRAFRYLDVPSPIPARQRPIIVRPMGRVHSQTPPEDIVSWIRRQLKLHKGNAIVHVTYAMAARLRPFDFWTVANFTPEEKGKALKKFKAEGGVWLAAGCAEGIDLPHDECRVNLIPKLPWGNLGNAVIKKAYSREGGPRKYELEVLRTVIQQAGRSTRDLSDHSTVVIGDPMFARLIERHGRDLPKSFIEAIRWS